MTRIGFYILRAAQPQAFVCRLCQQLYQRGQSIYVHAPDDGDAQRIDEALWTYRPDAFVPHDMLGAPDSESTPILIGQTEPPEHCHDVLINLAPDVPLFFSRFERVAEIIPADDTLKTAGRHRFQFYRDRGYQLDTYQDVDG
ncbi:DNA polymerase III subunit chi [uncultured Abyssibacter sp.]|uniref:DNA polymerase III subunit chi n=1 Tax=uncultured Abyssibacter sp. TaxID=2320202 RepID=UPI0032B2B37C